MPGHFHPKHPQSKQTVPLALTIMRATRQSHRKSRRGCERCKQRSVKCDEKRPCGNCVRRGDCCSLAVSSQSSRLLPSRLVDHLSTNPTRRGNAEKLQDDRSHQSVETGHLIARQLDLNLPSTTTSKTANIQRLLAQLSEEVSSLDQEIGGHSETSQSHGETPNSSSTVTREISSREWMRDLQLYHHYCSTACKTLACDTSINDVWRNFVPEAACAHEFLMHGVLAISALHLAHTSMGQKDEYNDISTQHQTAALELFACRLQNVNQSNCHAYVLLGSIVHMMNNFLIADMHRKGEAVTVNQLLQSFKLLKGISDIVSLPSAFDWLKGGPIAAFFMQNEVEPVDIIDGFLEHVDALEDVIQIIARASGQLNMTSPCLCAMESLKDSHRTIAAAASGSGSMWIWPVTLSEEFLNMINDNNPAALIIVSYFVVLMYPFEKDRWFLKGWSSGVFAAIENAIDDAWKSYIEWPKLVASSI